ncbi:MAG: hypothetical protein AVDCRST_MAG77-4956, partial [uncultured Chloroflexi bacterium]
EPVERNICHEPSVPVRAALHRSVPGAGRVRRRGPRATV